MKINTAEFLRSCVTIKQFPRYPFPEFAFFGRSNVGKSSLINMITGMRYLTKTGSRPGVTRAVNFFLINGNISIADLPGYGYAKLPKSVSAGFLPLIKKYVTERENLKLAFLLVDIRRIPDDKDRDVMNMVLDRGIPVAVIITKSDKMSRGKRNKVIAEISGSFGIDGDSILFTSAETGEGRDTLLRLMREYGN